MTVPSHEKLTSTWGEKTPNKHPTNKDGPNLAGLTLEGTAITYGTVAQRQLSVSPCNFSILLYCKKSKVNPSHHHNSSDSKASISPSLQVNPMK